MSMDRIVLILAVFFSFNISASEYLKSVYYISEGITEINKQFVNDELITAPLNTKQWLIKFKSNGLIYCLAYRIPYTQDKKMLSSGLLYLSKDKNCILEDNIIERDIASLKMSPNLVLKIRNLAGESLVIELERSQLLAKKNMPEKKLDDEEYCLRMHDDCSAIIEDKCDLCRDHYTIVAGGACADRPDKICGKFPQGGRGELAVYRGHEFSDLAGLFGCQNASIEGMCDEGLETRCENNKLFCY